MLDKFLEKRSNIILLAIVAVFMESLTSPCLKLGGRYPFLSAGYIAWFCLAVLILGKAPSDDRLSAERVQLHPHLRVGDPDLP